LTNPDLCGALAGVGFEGIVGYHYQLNGEDQMNYDIKPVRTRRAQIALAAGLACLAGAAFADQTHISYSLAAGATKTINVPAVNTPVQVSCTQITNGDVGAAQATIIRGTTNDQLTWVGFDLHTSTVSGGSTPNSGLHIIWCDYGGEVDIESLTPTEIQVKNSSSFTAVGVVMFVY
jgi:hypothetical protein